MCHENVLFLIYDSGRILNPAATRKLISFELGVAFIRPKNRSVTIDICPTVTGRYFFSDQILTAISYDTHRTNWKYSSAYTFDRGVEAFGQQRSNTGANV
jgi:hypothetical protein